jgi:hypothetical protein
LNVLFRPYVTLLATTYGLLLVLPAAPSDAAGASNRQMKENFERLR